MNLIKQKINKPTVLLKTLKSLGFPFKVASALKICLKDKNEIAFDET